MKRLITVLGTTCYKDTTYAFPSGQKRRGRLFAAQAAAEYKVEQVDCLATDEAWEAHGKALEDASPASVKRHAVHPIRGETELWDLFQTVVDIPQAGDRLVLDLTHGFRSMPLIGAVAASVAALTKGATIEGLIYGAFEQRDDAGVTPVIDLTPFYTILKWQAACEEFARTGLAGGLLAALGSGTSLPDSVKAFQQHAGELALALTMMNPSAAQRSARELKEAVEKVDATPTGGEIPPVLAVAGWVGEACAPFRQHDCEGTAEERLRHEAAMIKWYRDHGHYTQVATLLREWLVSLAGWALDENHHYPQDKDARRRAEAAVVYLDRDREDQGKVPPRADLEPLRNQVWLSDLLRMWREVRCVRNSIAHCAMLPDPKTPTAHRCKLDALVPDGLDALLTQAHLSSSQ